MMRSDKHSIPGAPESFIPPSLWPGPRAHASTTNHPARIDVGTPVEISDGIYLLRLPLPFALNHINVYLVRERDGWVLIDCGVNTSKTRELWDHIRPLVPKLNRIIVTHHHPDHIGLAGWLSDRYDTRVHMTPGEYAVAGRYSDPDRDIVAERFPLWRRHGLSEERSIALLQHMPRYDRQVSQLPADRVQFIEADTPMQIGHRIWRPIIGRGHAPEHLSLLNESDGLLIGGDQILPVITPNIAVWPGGDQNPLESYFQSLGQFLNIAPETLLLPSHHQPLFGVTARATEILTHHDNRLAALWNACEDGMNACELMPALFGRPLRDAEMGFGLGEAIAHLNYLEARGYLLSNLNDKGVHVFRRAEISSIIQGKKHDGSR